MSRMDRINAQVKRAISEVLHQEMQDPRLQFVSVTYVQVAPDLQVARVGFSVLGSGERVKEAEVALVRVSGIVRRRLGEKVNLRHTPRVDFVYDPSIEYSARVEQTLNEIKKAQMPTDRAVGDSDTDETSEDGR